MNCPNCSNEVPHGALECPGCLLIFAKWKAAAQRPLPLPKSSSSDVGSGKWIGLVILAGCAWGYSRFSGDSVKASQLTSGAVTEKQIESPQGGSFTPPSDHCGYEGRIMDLALQTPIPGAKVYLDTYTANSNATGRYRIIVRSMRGKCQPFPSVRHSNYQKNYWTQHFPDIEAEERLAMRSQTFQPERIKGIAGKSIILNFSLFPKEVPESLLTAIAENAAETEIDEVPEADSLDDSE